MLVYLVRHGESEENATRTYTGGSASLTPTGIKQAKQLAKRFKKIPINKIYSSDMVRAKQTTDIINKVLKMEVNTSELIREKAHATILNGKRFDHEVAIEVMDQINKNMHDKNFRYSDEETFELLKERVFKFMRDLEKESAENILIVAHGLTMRAMVGYVLFGESFNSYDYVKLRDHSKTKNTGITLFEFDDNKEWTLLTWNDYAHLGE